MAENQAAHRLAWENKALDANIGHSRRGQVIGLIITVVLVCGAMASVYLGANIVACGMVGGTLAFVVSSFLGLRGAAEKKEKPDTAEKTTP